MFCFAMLCFKFQRRSEKGESLKAGCCQPMRWIEAYLYVYCVYIYIYLDLPMSTYFCTFFLVLVLNIYARIA